MPLLTYDEITPNQVGGSIREDLLDFMEILSPRDTPLYNNLGSLSVHAGYVEYLEDTLTAAAENAWAEGVAASDPILGVPTRNVSIVQNFQKHFHVSGRQSAVLHAGMSSMIAHQEMKAVREIKTDIELTLHRGTATTGNSNVAAKLNGFLNLANAATFTSQSGTTLTEAIFNSVAAAAYNNPINLRECYLGMNLKRTVNQFTTSVTRYIPAGDRRQLDIIDVYEAEMGVIALFKSRYQLSTTPVLGGESFIIIDPDYFQVGWLRPLVSQTLGLDGDRERRMIVGELTLIARSGNGYVGSDRLIDAI